MNARQKCDRCGKEIVPFVDAVYSLAENEEAGTGRHWHCHEEDHKSFQEASQKVEKAMDSVKKTLSDLENLFK